MPSKGYSWHQGHHQPSLGDGREVGSRELPWARILRFPQQQGIPPDLSWVAAGFRGAPNTTADPMGCGCELEQSLHLVSSPESGTRELRRDGRVLGWILQGVTRERKIRDLSGYPSGGLRKEGIPKLSQQTSNAQKMFFLEKRCGVHAGGVVSLHNPV